MQKICGIKDFIIRDYNENYLMALGVSVQVKNVTRNIANEPCYRCALVYNDQELRTDYDYYEKNGYKFYARGDKIFVGISYKDGESIQFKSDNENVYIKLYGYQDDNVDLLINCNQGEKIYNLRILKTILGNAIIVFRYNDIEIPINIGFDIKKYNPQVYFEEIAQKLNDVGINQTDKIWIDLMLSDSRVQHRFRQIIESIPNTIDEAYQLAYNSISEEKFKEMQAIEKKYGEEFKELEQAKNDYLAQQEKNKASKR